MDEYLNNLDADTVLAEFNARIGDSREHFRSWRTEAKSIYDIVAGHQWDATDEQRMEDEGRPTVTFNVAGKFLDSVAGLQVNNRQTIRYYPRTLGDAQVNQLLTGAVAWCRDQCDAEHEESDAFWDLLCTGMGWIEISLDEENDPEGMITQQRRDPLTLYADPLARKRNLSDATWVARKMKLTADEYRQRFGEDAPSSGYDQSDADDDEDAVITVRTQPQDYQNAEAGGRTRRTITAWDYQFSRVEPAVKVSLGPESRVVSPQEYEPVAQQLAQRGGQARQVQTKVYYRAWICHGEVKRVVRLPYQDGFLYKAITGKRDRNTGTWYGLGRAVVDPQLWTNKFFSSILYQLAKEAKGGLLAEESAFENRQKAESQWAMPGSITWVRDGALREGAIQPKPAAPYPQGMDRLMQFSLEALPATTGINLEMLGLADRQQAGVVESQRKQSAMAIIAWAFDGMRRYYREAGRLMAALVRDYMADGRLIRIVGEEGQQYVPLVRDRLVGQYDVIVDEAPTSPNMQERTWAILQMFIPQALQAGFSVPPDVIDYAPIPADLAQKWKAAMQDPQKAQMAQAQFQLAMRQGTATAVKDETAAQLNVAKTQETAVTIPPDIQLIVAQTIKTLAEAGRAQREPDAKPDARRPN